MVEAPEDLLAVDVDEVRACIPPDLAVDIEDWDSLEPGSTIRKVGDSLSVDELRLAERVGSLVAQKGFAFVKASVAGEILAEVESEVEQLGEEGQLVRTPVEAASALFGPTCSGWTFDRELPGDGGSTPDTGSGLDRIEAYLAGAGRCIAEGCRRHCKLDICGRTAATVHRAALEEDDPAPPLESEEEAASYLDKCIHRKLVLLHYLGPSAAVVTITPHGSDEEQWKVVLRDSPLILAFRNDAVEVDIQTTGYAVSVQLDYTARARSGGQFGLCDLLPPPSDLQEWYEQIFESTVALEKRLDNSAIPMDILREAYASFYTADHVQVSRVAADLPRSPLDPRSPSDPFDRALEPSWSGAACSLLGQDVVRGLAEGETLIRSFQQWDTAAYYTSDPDSGAVYTRHFAVLDPEECWDLKFAKEFIVPEPEIKSLDPRARMLFQTLSKLVMNWGSEFQGEELGVYVGLSGRYDNPVVTKYSYQNSTLGSIAGRLSYWLGSRGPSMCVDCEDSSGIAALNKAVSSVREGACDPHAVVCSSNFLHPAQMMQLSFARVAGGSLFSASGRTRAFDSKCDGFTPGEASVTMLLSKIGEDEDPDDRKVHVCGSALTFSGRSASFGAPNAPSMTGVLSRASRDAKVDLQLLDVVEASAGGLAARDAVELGVLKGALKLKLQDGAMPQDKADLWQKVRGAEFIGTRIKAVKTVYGNTFAPSGLVAVARACQTILYGLNAPDLHLRQPTALADGASPESWRFATEVWEAKTQTQLVGVSSFSIDGTNVHCVLQGNRGADIFREGMLRSQIRGQQKLQHAERAQPWRKREPAPLAWWPGAAPPRKKPLVGYFIRGTWDAWKHGARMEEEDAGVYGYTIIMGQNNWEQFQIWEDDDYMKVLHPSDAVKGGIRAEAETLGPDGNVTPYPDELDEGKMLHVESCWRVSGDPDYVRLVNEKQEQQQKDREAAGEEVPFLSHPNVLAFAGSGAPKDYDGTGGVAGMPLARTNLPRDDGKPDDRYRVRLHTRGKKKLVEWVKLDESDGGFFFHVEDSARETFEHRYFIVGDHTFWKPVAMECANAEEGLHVAEALLLKSDCKFQIYRDADYDQGFFPRVPARNGGTMDSEIAGPLSGGVVRRSWRMSGKVGDRFRIEFRRHPNWAPSPAVAEAEAERRRRLSIAWEPAGRAEVDVGRLAAAHKYYIMWKDTGYTQEMKKDESGNFSLTVHFEDSKRESFQILLDENRMAAVYPRFNDASHMDENAPRAEPQGPDDCGAGKYWTIGAHPGDAVLKPKLATVMIRLEVEGGWPRRVSWESTYNEMSHQRRLAWGCKNVIERHARLHKLEVYKSEQSTAKETGQPEWASWSPSRPGDVVGTIRPAGSA